MKQYALLVTSMMGLESLGCGENRFPQYSSRYELQESSYTDPAFVGEKRIPWNLTVTHRMKYIANTWDDKMRFEFTAQNPAEIEGAVIFDLELLTSDSESSFPQEHFKGEQIHAEQKYYGGAFCNYQYQYHAFAVLTPGPEGLSQVYPEQGEYLYTDPSGMPLYESFNPDEFEPDEEAIEGWYQKIEENGEHITLELVISRNIKDDLSGCDGESYLPYDTRSRESLRALYHSAELYDEEDPRLGFDELLENSIPPIDLFKDLITDVKDF